MDRAVRAAADSIDHLIDREQARLEAAHPRSRAAWSERRRHFLYSVPSHWMRRWRETLLHAFHMNHRIRVTPFHRMLLVRPATTAADIETHTAMLDRFAELVAPVAAAAV